MTRRRRASVAFTPAEARDWLRCAYLERHEVDPEFGRALLALYARHAEPLLPLPVDPLGWWLGVHSGRDDARELWGVTEPIGAYVAAVDVLCRYWRLDRLHLPPDRAGELAVGPALVHEFCRWRGIYPEHGPASFAQGYDGGDAVPDTSGGPWDPRRETYQAARSRLGHRRASDLRTIAEQAEAAGLLFLDRWPELQRDLGWLYRHVARRETYASIAETDLPPSLDVDQVDMVRQAVGRMARRVFPGS